MTDNNNNNDNNKNPITPTWAQIDVVTLDTQQIRDFINDKN